MKQVDLLRATWQYHVYWEMTIDSQLIECIVVVSCADSAP